MPKHYREGCYDPDCGICYPPLAKAKVEDPEIDLNPKRRFLGHD